MAGTKPDAGKIGQDRQYQDPQEAIDADGGVYSDPVDKMPMEERTQERVMPRGPDPSPFTIRG